MPIKLTISGHLGHSGVSQRPGAGFNLFLEKWKFPAKGTSHLVIEGPNSTITVGLKEPQGGSGHCLLAWSHFLPAQASLHEPA